jgi:hypothetical protein
MDTVALNIGAVRGVLQSVAVWGPSLSARAGARSSAVAETGQMPS